MRQMRHLPSAPSSLTALLAITGYTHWVPKVSPDESPVKGNAFDPTAEVNKDGEKATDPKADKTKDDKVHPFSL